jgi:hypothetical protein
LELALLLGGEDGPRLRHGINGCQLRVLLGLHQLLRALADRIAIGLVGCPQVVEFLLVGPYLVHGGLLRPGQLRVEPLELGNLVIGQPEETPLREQAARPATLPQPQAESVSGPHSSDTSCAPIEAEPLVQGGHAWLQPRARRVDPHPGSRPGRGRNGVLRW